MITLHDLLDNFCCTDPYTDYAIVNIKTGEVLVDCVHDRTYEIDDVAALCAKASSGVGGERWENDILYSSAPKSPFQKES